MADLLDQIRTDMSARLTELRPLVEEHRRLEAALLALGDVASKVPGSAAPEPQSSPAPRSGRSPTGRTSRPSKPRKRAPRGANRQAVLRAVQERPGSTSAELAAASGVEPNTLYGLLSRLVKDGTLQTSKLPTGRTVYALGSTPSSGNTSE